MNNFLRKKYKVTPYVEYPMCSCGYPISIKIGSAHWDNGNALTGKIVCEYQCSNSECNREYILGEDDLPSHGVITNLEEL